MGSLGCRDTRRYLVPIESSRPTISTSFTAFSALPMFTTFPTFPVLLAAPAISTVTCLLELLSHDFMDLMLLF